MRAHPQSEPPPQTSVDLLSMARFLVLPGASRLLEAFATIPPGPLRDSVITHAEVIAATYSGAPPEAQMPDPLLMASQRYATAPSRPVLSGPSPAALAGPAALADSIEGQIVALSLEGYRPGDIVARLGVGLSRVYDAKREAKLAGVTFPTMMGKRAGKKPAKGKQRFAQHVWHTDMSTVSPQAYPRMQSAADGRGISVEDYLDRRRIALEMGMAQHSAEAIGARVNEDPKVIKNWFSQARGAGHNIPYSAPILTAEVEDLPPPPARLLERWEDTKGGARAAISRAAEKRGITPAAYCDLRESILQARMAGVSGMLISERTGETYTAVKDIIAYGSQYLNLTLPPITEGGRHAHG